MVAATQTKVLEDQSILAWGHQYNTFLVELNHILKGFYRKFQVSQNPQEHTCVGVSFLSSLLKRDCKTGIFL